MGRAFCRQPLFVIILFLTFSTIVKGQELRESGWQTTTIHQWISETSKLPIQIVRVRYEDNVHYMDQYGIFSQKLDPQDTSLYLIIPQNNLENVEQQLSKMIKWYNEKEDKVYYLSGNEYQFTYFFRILGSERNRIFRIKSVSTQGDANLLIGDDDIATAWAFFRTNRTRLLDDVPVKKTRMY